MAGICWNRIPIPIVNMISPWYSPCLCVPISSGFRAKGARRRDLWKGDWMENFTWFTPMDMGNMRKCGEIWGAMMGIIWSNYALPQLTKGLFEFWAWEVRDMWFPFATPILCSLLTKHFLPRRCGLLRLTIFHWFHASIVEWDTVYWGPIRPKWDGNSFEGGTVHHEQVYKAVSKQTGKAQRVAQGAPSISRLQLSKQISTYSPQLQCSFCLLSRDQVFHRQLHFGRMNVG